MAAGAQAQQQGLALLRAGLRRVLRVHHEKLPPPMKKMGDAYARQVGVVLATALPTVVIRISAHWHDNLPRCVSNVPNSPCMLINM